MTEELAAVAVAPSLGEPAIIRRDLPIYAHSITMADRAERGVQLVSRWAGILTFVGALVVIAYLIF